MLPRILHSAAKSAEDHAATQYAGFCTIRGSPCSRGFRIAATEYARFCKICGGPCFRGFCIILQNPRKTMPPRGICTILQHPWRSMHPRILHYAAKSAEDHAATEYARFYKIRGGPCFRRFCIMPQNPRRTMPPRNICTIQQNPWRAMLPRILDYASKSAEDHAAEEYARICIKSVEGHASADFA